jgi:hypothetical protein
MNAIKYIIIDKDYTGVRTADYTSDIIDLLSICNYDK